MTLINEGGTVWEDDNSRTIEDALANAEKLLRTEEFPNNWAKSIIQEIKKSIKNNDFI